VLTIAIFGKAFTGDMQEPLQLLMDRLGAMGAGLYVYNPFYSEIKDRVSFTHDPVLFSAHKDIARGVDFLFSVGGDGTLLDTITLVRDSGIPVLGINLGRLGFLSGISRDRILQALDSICQGRYRLDQRTLIRLETSAGLFGDLNYALNEVTVHKKLPLSLITLETIIDDKFLLTYRGDGLIVATPTGSTAYSLSSGGPIIVPDSENFVITPIAPHNLTVRPVVISDKSIVRIKAVGRSREFFVSLDSRTLEVDASVGLTIKKEGFVIRLVQMEDENFFQTIRNKLMWGADARN